MNRNSFASFESIITIDGILCEVYFHYVAAYNTFLVTYYPDKAATGVSYVLVHHSIKNRWMSLESTNTALTTLLGELIEREFGGENQ